MTLKERQEEFRKKQGKEDRPVPVASKKKPKKRRGTYQWGAKAFLTGFEIGETRVYRGRYKWSSLRSIGSMLKRHYGVLYTFHKVDGNKIIARVL